MRIFWLHLAGTLTGNVIRLISDNRRHNGDNDEEDDCSDSSNHDEQDGNQGECSETSLPDDHNVFNLDGCGRFVLANDLSDIADITHIDLSGIESLKGTYM